MYALCSSLSEESKKLQQVYQLYRREKNEEGLFWQEGKQIVLINRKLQVCIMNIGFWSCIILVIPFVIIGVLFAIFKEKVTKFVSGFNSFSKEEQAMYDKAQISRDIRNQCFIWTVIMLAGATLSCFLTPYMAIPTDRKSTRLNSSH